MCSRLKLRRYRGDCTGGKTTSLVICWVTLPPHTPLLVRDSNSISKNSLYIQWRYLKNNKLNGQPDVFHYGAYLSHRFFIFIYLFIFVNLFCKAVAVTRTFYESLWEQEIVFNSQTGCCTNVQFFSLRFNLIHYYFIYRLLIFSFIFFLTNKNEPFKSQVKWLNIISDQKNLEIEFLITITEIIRLH